MADNDAFRTLIFTSLERRLSIDTTPLLSSRPDNHTNSFIYLLGTLQRITEIFLFSSSSVAVKQLIKTLRKCSNARNTASVRLLTSKTFPELCLLSKGFP